MSYHLIDLVQNLGTPRVLVVGDLILDRYVWGNAERISQEAPVILLRQDGQEVRLGGAANVGNMLRGLEAQVTIAGVVGGDADGDLLQKTLMTAGVNCAAVIRDDSRPTTVKERLMGRAQNRHPHQILRVDRESREPLGATAAAVLVRLIDAALPDQQAVLVSDYSKGVCTPEILSHVIHAARTRKIPVIVDPGAAADYRHYRGATAVTPNRLETKLATGLEINSSDAAFAAGRQLCRQLDLECAFVTLDSDGIALVMADGRTELFRTRKREVCDITGAGDMVLATIGVGAAEGVAPQDLARLANIAGGLEVEQIGVVAIRREQILADLLDGQRQSQDKVSTLDDLCRRVEARRRLGQRIVFTNGCFDLLHPGHVHFLQEAASLGDTLIVAVNSDETVRKLKGPDRPVIAEHSRAAMLAALECVDHVLIFHEATPHHVLQELKPHVLVKGGTTHDIVAREIVEAYGGQVRSLAAVPDFSTTSLVQTIRGAKKAA